MPANRPAIHVVAFGQPGTEKSTLFAAFPKPMLVLATDPFGKEAPYLRRGIADANFTGGEFSQSVRVVRSRTTPEKALIQLEFFHEPDPDRPQAWLQLKDRMVSVRTEVFQGGWATVVLDGVTLAEIYCRNYHQFHEHSPLRTTKEPRQIFGAATNDLERLLVMTFGALPCNVCISAHVDSDKDEIHGTFVHSPSLPGRLRTRQEVSAAYTEVYRSFYDKKTDQCWLQTKQDDRYHAMSTFLRAPNPCPPEYEALFANWDKENAV